MIEQYHKLIIWVVVLSGSVLVSFLLSLILGLITRKRKFKKLPQGPTLLLEESKKNSINTILIILALFWILSDVVFVFPNIHQNTIIILKKILVIYAIIIIAKFSAGVILGFFKITFDKLSQDDEVTTFEAFYPLFRNIAKTVVYIIAGITILSYLGINISALIVSLGVAGAALALAVKDTIENAISGIIIMFDKPFRIGDRIKLSTGEVGDIMEIGLRSCKILTFDNTLIILPNNMLLQQRLINLSYPNNILRVRIMVGVAYGTNTRHARSVMEQVATKHPNIMKDPAPYTFVDSLDDSAITLGLFVRVGDYTKAWGTEKELIEQIYEAFKENDIEIPFPQMDVHINNK